MTQVIVTKAGQLYTSIEVKGHSGFAVSGKDLVCASISTIVFGFANAIDEIEGAENIKFEDAFFNYVNSRKNKMISHYMGCVISQFKTLEEAYPENIQVRILERRPYEI